MKNLLFILLLIIYLSPVYAQGKPKLLVKIVPSQTEATLYSHVSMNAWLYNKGKQSISVFRQDFTAPAWYGVIEKWYCSVGQKKETFPKLIEQPSSGFNENNIITLFPGDSMMVDTFGYTFHEHNRYAFTYNITASRKKVKMSYAMTSLARKKVAALTEFNITSSPLVFECKQVSISPEKIKNLSLEEVVKDKKIITDLVEAFKIPEDVFILALKYCRLSDRDLEAINRLRNIHSIRFTGVSFPNNKLDTAFFDFPYLKDLVIEDSAVEITDNFLTKLTGLEQISFKNIVYHNPSKALSMLTSVKSIVMNNCQMDFLNTDFSKLQNLTSIDISGNNLKYFPPVNNLPKLEFFKIQQNRLTMFPEVFNNPSLKSISLSGNDISSVPGDIGKLKTLTDLDISQNRITEIPSQIANLEGLTVLKLTRNQLSHLPDAIKKLIKLKVLFLDENNYAVIDPVLFKIQSLEQLSLRKNNITVLPDKFSKLALLSKIDIAENKIFELPKGILRLKNLSSLNVKGNPVNENKTSRALRTMLKSGYEE
jgi:Leucine-rich repeat (LRR) protein